MKLVINKDIIIPDPLTHESMWIGEAKEYKLGRQFSIRILLTYQV